MIGRASRRARAVKYRGDVLTLLVSAHPASPLRCRYQAAARAYYADAARRTPQPTDTPRNIR